MNTTERTPCDLPGLPGRYVRPDGTLTSDPAEADTYRPAADDTPTWRPPPPAGRAGK